MYYALIDTTDAITRIEPLEPEYVPDLSPAKGLTWMQLVDQFDQLQTGQVHGAPVVTVDRTAVIVTRHYPAVAAPPEPVPASVTMRQARLQLLAIGRFAEVDAAVSQMGTEAQIVWDYSSVVERGHALIAPMQQLLGYTDAQMDELFIAASKL